MQRLCIFLILGAIFILSCKDTPKELPNNVEAVLEQADDNASSLRKVIDHFSTDEDSLKREAAIYLIGNLGDKHAYTDFELQDSTGNTIPFNVLDYPDYDSLRNAWDILEDRHGELHFERIAYVKDYDTISSDYLINNIDLAFRAWREKPWAHHLEFKDFCAYVLPHRSTNEPLSEWRSYFIEEYDWLQDSMQNPTDPAEAAALINEDLKSWFSFDPRFYEHPADQGLQSLIEGKMGRCEDMTNLAIYAMRANGIAVTSDYTPYWANTGNNHAWNALINKDGGVTIFMGAEANPGEYSLSNRYAKVYRKTYARQEHSLTEASGLPADSLPGYINRSFYKDVTAEYGDAYNVRIRLYENPENHKVAYICVFNTGKWRPVDWAEIDGAHAKFDDMAGNVMYLPAYWENDKVVPAAAPFVLDNSGAVHMIIDEETDPVALDLNRTTRRTTEHTTDNIRQANLELGTAYILYYWSDKWMPLDTLQAKGQSLKFSGVPRHSLLWLKEKDGREEERIFTLDNSGQAVFW